MMATIGALLVALVGAAVGAYFAVIKSRRERLWLDRYETLRDIVLALGIVEAVFSSAHLELSGLTALNTAESRKLSDEWPNAMYMLRQHMAKLRLLFKESKISPLIEAVNELRSALFDINNYDDEDADTARLHQAAAIKAGEAIEAAIAVGQKHCV